MKKDHIEYVRLQRVSTGSWMTFRLPRVMHIEDSYLWIHDKLPGWEFVSGCPVNPDELNV